MQDTASAETKWCPLLSYLDRHTSLGTLEGADAICPKQHQLTYNLFTRESILPNQSLYYHISEMIGSATIRNAQEVKKMKDPLVSPDFVTWNS